MCKICDNPEGSMCRACAREMEEVRDEPIGPDPWWPMIAVPKRSINSVCGDVPEGFLYV